MSLFSLQSSGGIDATPLSPFMSSEVLDHNHLYIDGSKIQKDTGFSYSIPHITLHTLNECVERAIEAGIFPDVWKSDRK